MSNVEIITVVAICIIPIIALAIVLPKKFSKKVKKNKSNKAEAELPTLADVKAEEEAKTTHATTQNTETYTSEDFKGYLKNRQENRPISIEPRKSRIEEKYDEKIERMMNERRVFQPEQSKPSEQEEKTIIEQFDELSPEIRALILSGALDKKYFDEEE